mmetsp:Transcript_44040/g.42622  ORF Transcript_44040/g.42622 Transcript_44040/m.42622 type:complete len:275 (-) Transcript_44040:444-1268(-)
MQRVALALHCLRPILNDQSASSVLSNGGVPGSHRVDQIFIDGPDFVPLLEVGVLGRTLLQHELFEGLHSQTSPHDALDCWEARVIPIIHMVLLHKPVQLPFRQNSTDHVQLRKVINLDWPERELLLYPLVHEVPIMVLNGPQAMSHALMSINDGTGKVICWVSFVLVPSPMMLLIFHPEEDRVSQALHLVLHVDLCPHAPVRYHLSLILLLLFLLLLRSSLGLLLISFLVFFLLGWGLASLAFASFFLLFRLVMETLQHQVESSHVHLRRSIPV